MEMEMYGQQMPICAIGGQHMKATDYSLTG